MFSLGVSVTCLELTYHSSGSQSELLEIQFAARAAVLKGLPSGQALTEL